MKIHYATATALLMLPTVHLFSQTTQDKRPNILFILIDDMGYTDLSCTGSTYYETPNIDKLAREGTFFNQAYAACPVSSPSRAAIITGKYPARIDLTDYIPGNQAYGPHKDQKLQSLPFTTHLSLSEMGIAKTFKKMGYDTFFAGKWHLGETSAYFPTNFGFDINKGGNQSGRPIGGYFSPYKNEQLSDGPDGENLTDRLTDETIKYIKSRKDKPFFAYLSFYAVHGPLEAEPLKKAKYENKLKQMGTISQPTMKQINHITEKLVQDNPTYAAMLETVDENVGKLMNTLVELGIEDQTIVVLTSDNGGVSTGGRIKGIPTSNYPLRAGKGYLYEGGIRVPLIFHWKDRIPASKKCDTPVTFTDFYPTLLDLCGIPLNPIQHQDGISIKPLLFGKKIKRDAIYWHFPHYSGGLGGRPSSAIRSGDYKLIEFFEDNHVELYNIKEDTSEAHDLTDLQPKLRDKMLLKLKRWQKNIQAKVPVPNPYYSF